MAFAGLPDALGDLRGDPAGEDDVGLAAGEPGSQVDRCGFVELQEANQGVPGSLLLDWRQLVGGRDETVAGHRRRQQHGPGPVVDVAAASADLDADRGLLGRAGRELVAAQDLPVHGPGDQGQRAHAEHDQQEQESAAGIGPAQHRRGRSISEPGG